MLFTILKSCMLCILKLLFHSNVLQPEYFDDGTRAGWGLTSSLPELPRVETGNSWSRIPSPDSSGAFSGESEGFLFLW